MVLSEVWYVLQLLALRTTTPKLLSYIVLAECREILCSDTIMFSFVCFHVSQCLVFGFVQLNEGPNKTETRLVGDSEKPRNRRSTTNHRVQQAVKNGSGALKKSLVSVSWRVPHNNNNNKKPRQKHPGFDLDYSPPKTHPPHHN